MGSIELRIIMLAAAVAGMIMVLAEMIALHRKVAKYRDHLRGLYQKGHFLRLLSEGVGILVVVLVQPFLVSLLLLMALDNFNPQFSAHAMQQLKDGIQDGGLRDDGPPEHFH